MTTTFAAPDWIARRDGELRRGIGELTWLVLFGGSPQYRLVVAPAKGKFTCAVTETVSGKRLDRGTDFADADAALQGGLEELRQALGW